MEVIPMNPRWIDIIGLIFSLSGITILALGLIVSRKRAIKIGVSRMAEDSDNKNISLPKVQDEIRESRFALIGLALVIFGFLLQIIGNWPTL